MHVMCDLKVTLPTLDSALRPDKVYLTVYEVLQARYEVS